MTGVQTCALPIYVNPDLTHFDRILPCGFSDAGVTSIAQELKRDIQVSEILPIVERYVLKGLEEIAS